MVQLRYHGSVFALMPSQPNLTRRRCWRAFGLAGALLATPALAGPPPSPDAIKPDVDLYALMSGKCSTLKIAGRDFACKAVAYFHNEEGRANFTVALDDPADQSHVISFSGENGQRTKDNLYELAVDRMLLNSKDRPKVDGLPTPTVQLSAGVCRQIGNFAARHVSSIWCSATDANGHKYELRFESDGSPISVRRVRLSEPTIRQDPYR
jgi:hypothetical protein